MIKLEKIENLEDFDIYYPGNCEICMDNSIWRYNKPKQKRFYKILEENNEVIGYLCPDCIKSIKQIKD